MTTRESIIHRILGHGLSSRSTLMIRVADWAMAVGLVSYAAWCLAAEWPNPGGWTWMAVASALIGVAWAGFDWKAKLDARLRSSVVKNR